MPIPESQLETWSHQGSITQSSNTYNTIKNVLEASTTPYAGKNFKVFLQGSYGNDTNIYAESDVDIVIRLDDCFQSDLTDLTEDEKAAYKSAFQRRDLHARRLQAGCPVGAHGAVRGCRQGRRQGHCHRREWFASQGRRDRGDPVPALLQVPVVERLRVRRRHLLLQRQAGERIANYPKQHSANLTTKHQALRSGSSRMARVFKNMRSRMVDDGLIKAGVAPSYYIEGLLYNVPNEKLTSSYQDCVVNTLNWYRQEASKTDLVCANEQYYLLRDGHHTCWTQANCDAFVEAAVRLWNEW